MSYAIDLLDVVALTQHRPGRGLRRGRVGTVVERLTPDVFKVEFSGDDGRTDTAPARHAEQLIVLHDQPAPIA